MLTKGLLFTVKRSFLGFYQVKKTVDLHCVTGLVRNTQTKQFVVKMNSTMPHDFLFEGDCIVLFTEALLLVKPAIDVWTLTLGVDLCVRRKSDSVAVESKQECGGTAAHWTSCISTTLLAWRGIELTDCELSIKQTE